MTIEEAKAILKSFMENPLFSDIPKVCRAFDMAIKALEQQSYNTPRNDLATTSQDCISREAVLEQTRWIPVSERLPEDLKPVNITWVNHEPEPYYHDIKDKNFIATGIYYRGQWYWYSTTCADYLGEYGSNEVDKVDDAVEIVAWMPLPEPYAPSN